MRFSLKQSSVATLVSEDDEGAEFLRATNALKAAFDDQRIFIDWTMKDGLHSRPYRAQGLKRVYSYLQDLIPDRSDAQDRAMEQILEVIHRYDNGWSPQQRP